MSLQRVIFYGVVSLRLTIFVRNRTVKVIRLFTDANYGKDVACRYNPIHRSVNWAKSKLDIRKHLYNVYANNSVFYGDYTV